MQILALDSATGGCSVALWRDERVIAQRSVAMERGHAEALVPMIESVLGEAATTVLACDAIAVTVGPGGFTGLRIGLATAQGLALAADKPVLGITTLEAIAHAAAAWCGDAKIAPGALLVTLNSRRGDIFGQLFDADLRPLSDALALTPSALADHVAASISAATSPDVVVVGERAAEAAAALVARGLIANAPPGIPTQPDAAIVAGLAALAVRDNGIPEVPPEPLYLRPPDAKPARHGGQLRPPTGP